MGRGRANGYCAALIQMFLLRRNEILTSFIRGEKNSTDS